MADSTSNGKKTLWEKEKLLITSNFKQFLLFPLFFKRIILQTRKNQGLFGKVLSFIHQTYLPKQTVVFLCLKHCEKLRNCSFSTLLENLLPLSSNLKLSSANSFSLEEPKVYCLRKSLHVVMAYWHTKGKPRPGGSRCVCRSHDLVVVSWRPA